MKTIFGREPVLILAAIMAVVILANEFGVDVSDGQRTAIEAAVGAVLALIARSQVTPVASVNQSNV